MKCKTCGKALVPGQIEVEGECLRCVLELPGKQAHPVETPNPQWKIKTVLGKNFFYMTPEGEDDLWFHKIKPLRGFPCCTNGLIEFTDTDRSGNPFPNVRFCETCAGKARMA